MDRLIKVLFIEDSEDDTLLMLHELKKGGIQISHRRVETREQMSFAIEEEEWDLILSDYALPHFSGLTALELYQQKGLDIPFIVVSGTIGEMTAVEMMRAGAHDYLMKGNLARLTPAVVRELAEYQVRQQRLQAEKDLRLSEEKFSKVFYTSPDAVVILRLMDGKFIDVNPSFTRIFGYTYEEAVGKSIDILNLWVTPKHQGIILEKLQEQGEVSNWELTVRHKDGRMVTTLFSARLLEIQDELCVLTNMRDITERKRNELELRKLNRALRTTSECNQTLIHASDESALLGSICNMLVHVGGYRFAWIGYIHRNGEFSVKPQAFAGHEAGYLSEIKVSWKDDAAGQGPAGESIRKLKPVVIGDISAEEKFYPFRDAALERGYLSLISLPLAIKGDTYGALNIYADKTQAFDPDEIALLRELAEDLAFGIHTLRMRVERVLAWKLLEESNIELEHAYDATLEGWSRALELRERETAGHSQRVVSLTIKLAEGLGFTGEDLIHIRRGALLHDIGKMGVPDNILLKPGPLDDQEWVEMRQHPLYARQMLEGITYLEPALDIPLYHHEKWDGSGYPSGLIGENIPLSARIFSIIDVWDALLSDRPYRPAWSREETRSYLLKNAGSHFDPKIVDAFLKII